MKPDNIRPFLKAVGLVFLALVLKTTTLDALTTINEDYKAATVSGTTVVALDFQSDLFTSDDNGATFTLRETTSEVYEDVASLGLTVLAVGVDGLILRSSDGGINWASANAPVSLLGSFYTAAGRSDGSNPNRWIAAGDDGLDGIVFRSIDDGQTWTATATIADLLPEAAVWTGSRWLLAGRDQTFNEAVVFHSTDATTWTASTLPLGASPLLDIAADGNGTVLAAGESGQLLRSTDDGLSFSEIAPELKGGGDLNAVVVDSVGTFFVGGDEKLVLEIVGTTVSVVAPALSTAPSVADLVLIDGQPFAVGGFFAAATRTEPLVATITRGGGLDFVITAGPTLVGKNYFLETSIDLSTDSWDLVTGSVSAGNGADLTFEVTQDSDKRFWRVVEF